MMKNNRVKGTSGTLGPKQMELQNLQWEDVKDLWVYVDGKLEMSQPACLPRKLV